MKTKATGRYIPRTITESDIKTATANLITQKGLQAVSRNKVAQALGVLGPTISNELRMHFDDWLQLNFSEADRGLNRVEAEFSKFVPAALEVAAENGLCELSVQAVADYLGVNKALIYIHVDDNVALRRSVISEAVATRTHPEIVIAGLLMKEPPAVALDTETKRAAWQATEATLFGS